MAVYRVEAPPLTEKRLLPAFQAFLDYAMTTEQLNALLGFDYPSYLKFLKQKEKSIRGASTWIVTRVIIYANFRDLQVGFINYQAITKSLIRTFLQNTTPCCIPILILTIVLHSSQV